MKVIYRVNESISFEFEGIQTGKAAFEVVAATQELFGESSCGCCKSPHVRCNVRHVGEVVYYSIACDDCRAQLDFGQKKDGKGMWPKRTKDGQILPNRGWYVYDGSRREEDGHRQSSPPQRRQQHSRDEPSF